MQNQWPRHEVEATHYTSSRDAGSVFGVRRDAAAMHVPDRGSLHVLPGRDTSWERGKAWGHDDGRGAFGRHHDHGVRVHGYGHAWGDRQADERRHDDNDDEGSRQRRRRDRDHDRDDDYHAHKRQRYDYDYVPRQRYDSSVQRHHYNSSMSRHERREGSAWREGGSSEVSRRRHDGVQRGEAGPPVFVVMFVAMVGWGKNTVCEGLMGLTGEDIRAMSLDYDGNAHAQQGEHVNAQQGEHVHAHQGECTHADRHQNTTSQVSVSEQAAATASSGGACATGDVAADQSQCAQQAGGAPSEEEPMHGQSMNVHGQSEDKCVMATATAAGACGEGKRAGDALARFLGLPGKICVCESVQPSVVRMSRGPASHMCESILCVCMNPSQLCSAYCMQDNI